MLEVPELLVNERMAGMAADEDTFFTATGQHQAGRQGGKKRAKGKTLSGGGAFSPAAVLVFDRVAEWRQLICVKIILGCWRKV